jgi:hypothetical protein
MDTARTATTDLQGRMWVEEPAYMRGDSTQIPED